MHVSEGLWYPVVRIWDEETGEMRTIEGPVGFYRYERAVEASRFLLRGVSG